MDIQSINQTLTEIFGTEAVKPQSDQGWQIEQENFRLLVLLSEDKSWLRLLLPITSADLAQQYFPQLLEANFDQTQQTRYALHQGVLWGVYHHGVDSLVEEDLKEAIATLIGLQQQGLNSAFSQLAEQQVMQIIRAAKMQGQSLESTIQNLERFYQEGLLGGLDQAPEEREQFINAWKSQLTRLWDQVEASDT